MSRVMCTSSDLERVEELGVGLLVESKLAFFSETFEEHDDKKMGNKIKVRGKYLILGFTS